jgi:hypothetical protein
MQQSYVYNLTFYHPGLLPYNGNSQWCALVGNIFMSWFAGSVAESLAVLVDSNN